MKTEEVMIFLNNKKVIGPINFSLEEGWVEVIDTTPFLEEHKLNEKTTLEFNEPEETSFKTKRLYGKVSIYAAGSIRP